MSKKAEDEWIDLGTAWYRRRVAIGRWAMRVYVRGWYVLALVWGDRQAAERCREWLDGDKLYPPGKDEDSPPVAYGKGYGGKLTAWNNQGGTRYNGVSGAWPFPCRGCFQQASRTFLFVCGDCGETVCVACECRCYREGDGRLEDV